MKQVEERYISFEASKMAYRDIKNCIDTAKQEGLAEGIELGRKICMELGMNQKALDIVRNMLADGVDINLIMKYAGLTQEQIEKKNIISEITDKEIPPSGLRKPDGEISLSYL